MIVHRKAASMIELVIAIVIMGIAVMTLPLMLQRTQENNAFAMQQEAIVATRTAMGDIITYQWDENSIQNGVVNVLDVSSLADSELARFPDNNSTRRIGHVLADKRRKFFGTPIYATTPANLGQDGGNFDDIDDFIDNNKSFNLQGGLSDYKFNLDMNISVSYVNDSASYANNQTVSITFDRNDLNYSSNIKRISIILSGSATNTFRLDSYSTNIGASQLLRRTYQ